MFTKFHARRGQSTGEYAILVGVVIAAVLAMQVYMRRSVQAKIKDGYDYMSKVNYTAESGGDTTFNGMFTTNVQYEPTMLNSSLRTVQDGRTTTEMQQGGGVLTTILGQAYQKTGNVIYTNDI